MKPLKRRSLAGSPCGEVLDRLWDEIVLARYPDAGGWEYPDVVYRLVHACFEAKDVEIRCWRGVAEMALRRDASFEDPAVSADKDFEIKSLRRLVHSVMEEKAELQKQLDLARP